MARAGDLFMATRPWSFVMTAVSVTGAAAYAFFLVHAFDPLLYVLTLAGVVLLHAAANVLNDYYDTVRGVDVAGAPTTLYRQHPIIAGIMSPRQVRDYGVALLTAGLGCAMIIAAIRQLLVVFLALIGVVLLFTYSGPPGLKYRALGELGVFLSWGVFMWVGTFYVLTGNLSFLAAVAGIPVGLLVAAVLTANNLRDIEFDLSRGAKTFVALIGRSKGLYFYAGEIFSAYISLAILALMGVVPVSSLLAFMTFPQAYKLLRVFKAKIPEAADPMTAALVRSFGALYTVGMLMGAFLK
ncbi:MAG: UbiA family prenyltransferase [Thermofilum sp.]|nr:UbiA family prenyltransferase [Thermofilum sp.]